MHAIGIRARFIRSLATIPSTLARQVAGRLAFRAAFLHKDVTLSRDLRGLTWNLDPTDHLQRILLMAGCYEEPLVRYVVAELQRGDIVLDVGANIGYFSLTVATRLRHLGGGFVHAFEPAPDTFLALTKHIAVNDLGETVSAHQIALGNVQGTGYMVDNPRYGHRDLATRRLSPNRIDLTDGAVHVVQGDEFVRVNGLTCVDIIKIDVEGSEIDVLQGLAGTIAEYRPRLVLVEVDADNQRAVGRSPAAIHELMDRYGYAGHAVRADILGIRQHWKTATEKIEGNIAFSPAE